MFQANKGNSEVLRVLRSAQHFMRHQDAYIHNTSLAAARYMLQGPGKWHYRAAGLKRTVSKHIPQMVCVT